MQIDLAPILKLPRADRLFIIQAIAESLKMEEDASWMPDEEQQRRLDEISTRIHAGEKGKSWNEVLTRIKKEHGI